MLHFSLVTGMQAVTSEAGEEMIAQQGVVTFVTVVTKYQTNKAT